LATFTQWRTSVDKGEVRRVTYVYGDQRVLVEEVVDMIRQRLAVAEANYVTLSAADQPARDIWAAALQLPLTPDQPRLVLIRDADKLTRWEPLDGWFDNIRQLPGIHLLFVGADEAGKHKRPLELIQPRRCGQVVRCATPNDEDAIAWVRRRAPTLDQEMAYHLLRRIGGDLTLAAEVAAKLALFDTSPGPATINALCVEHPRSSFVDNLLAGAKRQALISLPSLGERDRAGAIGLLVSRVELLASLWRLSRAGQSAREVRGLPTYLVHQYLPLAKDYHPQRCAYTRRLLAVVDDTYRRGARDGVFEALVALW
jgi:DNA polymerase III delta subunit